MGTKSTTAFLTMAAGVITGVFALTTSAGAGDANAIPALNASGYLDPTILNATQTSSGSGSAGKVVQLNSSGDIDTTMLPPGVGPETVSVLAPAALTAPCLVNVYNNSGTANVRYADGTTPGKEANGFLLTSVGASSNATVYMGPALITGLSGLTPGPVYLSDSTLGAVTNTAPTTNGHVSQRVGTAVTASEVAFNVGPPVTLAS